MQGSYNYEVDILVSVTGFIKSWQHQYSISVNWPISDQIEILTLHELCHEGYHSLWTMVFDMSNLLSVVTKR